MNHKHIISSAFPSCIAIALLSFSIPALATSQSRESSSASQTGTAAPRSERSQRARQPAVSSRGTLAYNVTGQIFLQYRDGNGRYSETAAQVSKGSAYHRDPAFAEGELYFASDSGGHYSIWRIPLDSNDRPSGAATRVTNAMADDISPSVSSTSSGSAVTIAFQRGLRGDARVWIRESDGIERRLTKSERMELRPRISPDGKRVAMIVSDVAGNKVVVVPVSGGPEVSVATEAGPEDIAWGPDGQLAVGTRSGVHVVPSSGPAYQNLVTRSHGDIDWSRDGSLITIAERRDVTVSYNGDPDRGVDRTAHEKLVISSGSDDPAASATRLNGLQQIPAPRAVDAGRVGIVPSVIEDRKAANASAFDRFWERSARLYFSDTTNSPAQRAELSKWKAVRDKLRPMALAASSDSALDAVIRTAIRSRPPLRREATGKAAVSSAHPVATEAGLEIFRLGGNVIDATVAVSFALGVVEPDASGIGGYGEMVISLSSLEQPTLIEFMSRVPEAAGLGNTSMMVNGRYPQDGPALVNVPGTVAGMYLAWQRYGSRKLTWSQLLAPAIRAARDGYVVSDGLATTLATERERFAKYEGSRALFFRNGKPVVAGDTIRNPDLAWVLEKIAANGADGFYRGEVADRWARDLSSKGNTMTTTDLARYFANELKPVCGSYRDYRVCSGAPPVSGGADLVARLNLLEQFSTPRNYVDDPSTMHAALSAWFLTPSSRGKIADPALWPVDVASIVAKDTARIRWQCFNPDRALTPSGVQGDTLACLKALSGDSKTRSGTSSLQQTETFQSPVASQGFMAGHSTEIAESPCGDDFATEMDVCLAAGTTAFVVADAEGNVVAVTQTLGTWGGNFYVTPGLGFLSNDKLTSYGTNPSQYGARLPFARHGSTLAPTIAFKNGRPVFAVGAAGNAWITSAVYQTLLGALDYGLGPQAALELPRFLPGGGGFGAAANRRYNIQLEDGFSPAVTQKLTQLGYDLSFVSARGELREGYGAAIRIDRGSVTAGADPRRSGAAGAVESDTRRK